MDTMDFLPFWIVGVLGLIALVVIGHHVDRLDTSMEEMSATLQEIHGSVVRINEMLGDMLEALPPPCEVEP